MVAWQGDANVSRVKVENEKIQSAALNAWERKRQTKRNDPMKSIFPAIRTSSSYKYIFYIFILLRTWMLGNSILQCKAFTLTINCVGERQSLCHRRRALHSAFPPVSKDVFPRLFENYSLPSASEFGRQRK